MKYVWIWIAEAALYCVVLVFLFSAAPENAAYDLVSQFTGMIPGDTWEKYYFLALCVLSLLTVSLVIYITLRIRKP